MASQCCQQVIQAWCCVVPVQGPTNSPPQTSLQALHEFDVVRVPHGASILEEQSDKRRLGNDLAPIIRVCLSSPRVLLALLVTAKMWASQVASVVSVTPEYLV